MIHLPTLMITLLAGVLVLNLQLTLANKGLKLAELRTWNMAFCLLLIGGAALMLRPWIREIPSILLGNGLIGCGFVLIHKALTQFFRDTRPHPTMGWLGLCWICVLPSLWVTQAQRVSLNSGLHAALLVPSLVLLLRQGWQVEKSLRAVSLSLLITCLALAFQSFDAWAYPQAYQHLLDSPPARAFAFMVGFLVLLGVGYGFVLACFERLVRQTEERAATDGLTGCLNRCSTDTLLSHLLDRGRRDASPVSFALMDLDHFKTINDTHGHSAGDTALRAVAAAVRSRLRDSDVFGRMGGEEFGIILPATPEPGARQLLEVIRQSIQALQLQDDRGRSFNLTVSIGFAVASKGSQLNAETIYARADEALYAAKAAGRNRVMLAEPPALSTSA